MARGPRATSAREPGQVRKEAALSGLRWAQRGTSRPEPLHDASLRGPDLDGGCTVHLLCRSVHVPADERGATARAREAVRGRAAGPEGVDEPEAAMRPPVGD